MPSQNLYVEILIPKMMVLGDGALGRIMRLGMDQYPYKRYSQIDLSVLSHMCIKEVDSLQPERGLSTTLAALSCTSSF